MADLGSFTDIAFTSRNGIEAVLERLGALGAAQGCTPASALARLNVWALGADAGALAAAGIVGVRVPKEVRAAEAGLSGQPTEALHACSYEVMRMPQCNGHRSMIVPSEGSFFSVDLSHAF